MQSRKMSAIESVANVAIGYLLSVAVQVATFPLFGIDLPIRDNFLLGIFFTVVSLSRSYAIRRFFNFYRE